MKKPTDLLRLSLSIGLLILYTSAESNAPVVQTKLGGLRGQYVSVKGKETVVQAYLGVPFAKPPIGPLRLAPPQPVEGWEGVRDATQQPLMCLQDRQITKDLFSNVSMTVEIPEVTGDKYAPGNMGLIDQVEALRWVKEHIHNFGGDSKSVTIFGESAGGVSVSLLLLSPLSTGLFHGAIAESGTAVMDALFNPNPLPVAQMVANMSGCESTNTEKIADCVRKLTADDILNIHKQNQMLAFVVTVDGQFLPKSAMEISQNHEMHKVPFMTGVNDNEGGWIIGKLFAPPGWENGVDRVKVMPIMAMFYPDPKDQWITELIADEYLGTSGNRVKNRDGFTELVGDIMFTIPALQTANFHRDAGVPVYLYEFQQTPSMLKKMRPSFVGSDHGDELMFVFGSCFTSHVIMDVLCTEEEEQLSKIMMSYWGNFAHTGSPNGAGCLVHGHSTDQKEITWTKNWAGGPDQTGGSERAVCERKGEGDGGAGLLGRAVCQTTYWPLRLAPPQPVEGWEGIRDATQQPLMCLQDRQITVDLFSNVSLTVDIPEVSEDCLYLNIYTPVKPAENTKLPVMVWIHGGGFAIGSASTYDGSALAAYQDVVVVLIQYRLGLLGFFSTGDKYAPGNMGLIDQVEALRWVKEHIHNFGGDSKSVTIFGESAGGVSVSLLLLSPLSTGLFHGAIAESGTAAMDVLFNPNPLLVAQTVANMSGCESTNTEKIAYCVRKLTADHIMNIQKQNQMLYFGVTVDGQFLSKSAMEISQNHEMHKVPFMTGVNDNEVGWLLAKLFAPPGWENGVDRVKVMPIMAMFYPDPKDQWITELIADEYLGTSGNRVKNRDGFTELVGDIMFTIPALQTANFHRDAGVPVYLYEFQQTPSMLKKMRPSFVGSDHGDELMFVFGYCFTSHVIMDGCTEEDEQLSRIMMSYWGNFARTGSPNGAGLVQWPQYGPEGDYLGIGLEQVPGQHLKRDRFHLPDTDCS
ncbi:hypothetical protein J4Q44_G00113560 [Coregonus suidteri]|uniref:Carboxylesterase type B domain-containing protein n=1 Tax=Coregonus suidteri TaxID=861788 RepID=A0AAN8QVG3_9TELE